MSIHDRHEAAMERMPGGPHDDRPEHSIIDDGGPAFPCDSRESRGFAGMSLRDYFAAHAPPMPEDLFNRSLSEDEAEEITPTALCLIRATREAEWRMLYADAMNAAREADASPRSNPAALVDAVTRLMKFVRTYRAGFVRTNTVGLDLGTMEKGDREHLDEVDAILAVGAAAVLAETGGAV